MLLSELDLSIFPLVQWCPCDDGRSSSEHVRLAKCGIGGTPYFRADDPVLAGWWEARRRGDRPCRCDAIAVDKFTAAELGLPLVFIAPPPFDPWRPTNDCELMGWGSLHSPWNDAEYQNHAGNPDLKEGSR